MKYNQDDLAIIIKARLNMHNMNVNDKFLVYKSNSNPIESNTYLLNIVVDQVHYITPYLSNHIKWMKGQQLIGKILIPIMMVEKEHVILLEINIYERESCTITVMDSLGKRKQLYDFLVPLQKEFSLQYVVWEGPYTQQGKNNTYCAGYVARMIEYIISKRRVPWGRGNEDLHDTVLRSQDLIVVNRFLPEDAYKFGKDDGTDKTNLKSTKRFS